MMRQNFRETGFGFSRWENKEEGGGGFKIHDGKKCNNTDNSRINGRKMTKRG